MKTFKVKLNDTITGLTNTSWDPDNIVSGRAATEDQVLEASKIGDSIRVFGFNKSGVTIPAGGRMLVQQTPDNLPANFVIGAYRQISFSGTGYQKVLVQSFSTINQQRTVNLTLYNMGTEDVTLTVSVVVLCFRLRES